MTWSDAEKSVYESEPRELYVFQTPTATTRLTSWPVDVVYASNTYTSVPLSRSSLLSNDAARETNDFTVELPATHALAQMYASYVPPRELVVTVMRYQPNAAPAVALAIGSGYVTGLSFKARFASFRVPGSSDSFASQIPSASATRICNHVLYDVRCQLSRATYEVAATIATIATDRKSLTVTVMGSPDQWFRYGELLHSSTTERRLILSQVGTTITFAFRLPLAILIGDPLKLYPGCDHSVATCKSKFSNVDNFGGLPLLPTSNPFWNDLRIVPRS